MRLLLCTAMLVIPDGLCSLVHCAGEAVQRKVSCFARGYCTGARDNIHIPHLSRNLLPQGILEIGKTGRKAKSSISNIWSSASSFNEPPGTNDWAQAEWTVRSFPTEPHPDLAPDYVALSCCRSLQFVDHPFPNAGLSRCFPFFTWECRKIITARQGGDTAERFGTYGALSPALQPFMGASRIVVGEGTLSPGTATRGDIISFPLTVHCAPVMAFQHSSGLIRDRIRKSPPVLRMAMRLEKARRPPLQGCWLIREVLDVRPATRGRVDA